jgi:hypothetical protein
MEKLLHSHKILKKRGLEDHPREISRHFCCSTDHEIFQLGVLLETFFITVL